MFLVPFSAEASGVPEQEVEKLRARLQQTEDQNSDLQERLKSTQSNLEEYRTMVLSLEDYISKDKQVGLTAFGYLILHSHPLQTKSVDLSI